jgi:hypothetical protein
MFSAKNLSTAIGRFEKHVGRSARLMDVALTSTSATFEYERGGVGRDYTVTVPGAPPPRGEVFCAGCASFTVSAVLTNVPSALIRRVRRRPGLAHYIVWSIDISGFDGPLRWTLNGRTRVRFVAFSADKHGHHLRQTCSEPLPPAHQPIGC